MEITQNQFCGVFLKSQIPPGDLFETSKERHRIEFFSDVFETS